ncbi:hypothetical protein GT204_07060 [Streptomyces sp. SID4919]|nr:MULTISPECIES: hypothetical protein [unclassified Streptomyces]MYY08667.1 hypothetical protein [Streptomyces sp. SID4919]
MPLRDDPAVIAGKQLRARLVTARRTGRALYGDDGRVVARQQATRPE